MIKVAAYQYTPANDILARKTQIQNILEKAASKQIEFLCLPEGSLTGYYSQEELARKNSLEVEGEDFQKWLEVFRSSASTVIVGFNERTITSLTQQLFQEKGKRVHGSSSLTEEMAQLTCRTMKGK